MANNIILDPANVFSVVVTDPASPTAGCAVRYGNMTGIASTDMGGGGNDATHTTVNFGRFVCTLSVVATASAIAVGDLVWYNDGLDKLDNTTTGTLFGVALAAVTPMGTTKTIAVLHVPFPTGAIGAGTVGAAQIAANAVITAKIADNNVTVGKLAAGIITADATGRALFAAGCIDAATFQSAVASQSINDAKLSDPSALILNQVRTAKFEYDFATDTGAQGTISFRGATLPAKARIINGACYVKNALTGAGASAAIQVIGANDVITAAAITGVPWSTSDAMVPVIPVNTTATCIKAEAAGAKPSLVISAANLTAGHIDLWLNYYVHD